MDVVNGVGVSCEAALRLLKQPVVPLHAIARLTFLHKHQARLHQAMSLHASPCQEARSVLQTSS